MKVIKNFWSSITGKEILYTFIKLNRVFIQIVFGQFKKQSESNNLFTSLILAEIVSNKCFELGGYTMRFPNIDPNFLRVDFWEMCFKQKLCIFT